MLFSICSKCEKAKWLDAFRTRVRNGFESYRSQCKQCESEQQVIRNREKLLKDEKYREKSLERLKEWGQKNKHRRNSKAEARRRSRYKDDSTYRGRVKAQAASYRARKLKATPSWLSDSQVKEIEHIYKTCPEGFDVDHITPLKGETVCGLHVPWNLQHLPASENRSKNNSFIYDAC